MKLLTLDATVELSTGTLASLTLLHDGESFACGSLHMLTKNEQREANDCLRTLLALKTNGQ